MSIENPLKYPYEKIWYAWYPVKVSGKYVWLEKLVKQIDIVGPFGDTIELINYRRVRDISDTGGKE